MHTVYCSVSIYGVIILALNAITILVISYQPYSHL